METQREARERQTGTETQSESEGDGGSLILRGYGTLRRGVRKETEVALDQTGRDRGSGHRRWSHSRGLGLWDPGGGAAGWAASLTCCPMEPWGPGSPRSPCRREEKNGVRCQRV